jgi:hypothetical protein
MQRDHHEFFIILNVAMGGGFPAAFGGGPAGATRSVTGTRTVYVTFTSGQPADFVNLNWLTFGHRAQPTTSYRSAGTGYDVVAPATDE